MPTYTFVNTENGDTETIMLKISEVEQYLVDNPKMKQTLATPSFGDPVRLGVHKQPNGWNDLVKEVSKKNHGSINYKNGEM